MSVLQPRGTISKALREIHAEGGPGLDYASLADQAGVPEGWLRQLDRGGLNASVLQHLERLCWILGRSPNDLLGYEADE
jgi:DNA-binding Xre family transcriptional regulator